MDVQTLWLFMEANHGAAANSLHQVRKADVRLTHPSSTVSVAQGLDV